MSDIRSILSDVSRQPLLLRKNLSVTDELAVVRAVKKNLEKREGDLKSIVLADRESRVGAEYYVSVTERAGSVSWAKVADELSKRLITAEEMSFEEYDALKAKHVGKPSEVVGVDPLPSQGLIRDAYRNGFVTLDLETTGLSTLRDAPVSYGVVVSAGTKARVKNEERYYSIVNTGFPVPAASVEIHGISQDEIERDGISLSEMASDIVAAMEGCPARIIVGQNLLGFDWPILKRFLPNSFERTVRLLDTRLMSKALWPGEKASLDAISARLGMPARTGAHNAIDDALLTTIHFREIARRLLGDDA